MQMKNKKLAIAIPTYNRASILKENIVLMLEEISMYAIPIYISDDSIDDETKSMIDEVKKEYEHIYYYKNTPGLGHDKNCLRTLALPTEDYIWYLGDSIIIKPGGIKKVLDVVENGNPDFVSVNVENRNLDLTSRIYNEGNELLVAIGWHLTMSGATIYANKINELLGRLDLVKCKNFPQTALIFEGFAQGNSELYWINDKIVYSNKNKKSYWSSAIFEVFLKDWDFFISNLPLFYLDRNKKLTIKKHSEKTGMFTFLSFLDYRSKGVYSFQVFRKYFKEIQFNSKVNVLLLLLISITPKGLLLFFKSLFYPEKQ